MSALAKIALALLSLLLSGGERGPDGRRDFRRELTRTLDLVFGIAITGFLAWKLGLLAIKPIEARGYDAIGPFMVALLTLALKAVLFVLVPAILLCLFLGRFRNLTPRLVIYGFVALAGTGIYHAAKQEAKAVADRKAGETAALEARSERIQAEVESMEQARANAEQREADDLKKYRAQLLALRNQARDRWRSDIQNAGAFGAEGEIPPMLRVFHDGPYEVKVTNAGARKACVNLVRTMRKPGTDIYLRCPADLYRDCQDIPSGATVKFYLQFDERSPACREQRYEYRVGTPLKPDPSWWSASALALFDERPPDMREPVISQDVLTVRGEIVQLEKRLSR